MRRRIWMLVVALASCRTPPEVVREVLPEGAESPGVLRGERDGVVVVLRHLDRRDLFALSHWNRPDAACEGPDPVLTVFLMSVSNRTPDRVLRFDTAGAVLDDGEARSALTRERFRELHPPGVEAWCRYDFLFDGTAVLDPPRWRRFRQERRPRTLMAKGSVAPSASAESFLVFERATLFAPVVTLRLSGWVLTNAYAASRPWETEIRYRQRLVRAKED